jgi:hypothetical protein
MVGVALAATGGERRGKERVAGTSQLGGGDVLILNVSYYISGTCAKECLSLLQCLSSYFSEGRRSVG